MSSSGTVEFLDALCFAGPGFGTTLERCKFFLAVRSSEAFFPYDLV